MDGELSTVLAASKAVFAHTSPPAHSFGSYADTELAACRAGAAGGLPKLVIQHMAKKKLPHSRGSGSRNE